MRLPLSLHAAVACALVALACTASTATPATTPPARTPAPGASPGFVAAAARLGSGSYADLARHLESGHALRDLARDLNHRLRVSAAITLRYAECGEANAFYDPAKREVAICLELVERLAEDFGAQLDDDVELADAVAGATAFIALHEAGHALVDVLELPITGREEDAVDQLSAWLLIGRDGGSDAVLSAAAAFSLAGDADPSAAVDFAGEHSLDRQRFFNMVCWVYGSDPDEHAALLDPELLPASRAEGCANEYERLDRSWRRLLASHLRG